MNDCATLWWILASVLVLTELMTGSFYLLMLAAGAALGALSAYAGLEAMSQWRIAALSSSALVFVCYLLRRHFSNAHTAGNPDMNLDIGETLTIDAWQPDGHARARYRGAQWTAVARPGQEPSPGLHRVVDVIGNRLLVEKL